MVIVDEALARRLELDEAWGMADHAETHGRLRPEDGVAVESVGGGRVIYAGRDSPLSRAVGLALAGPIDSADLDRIEAFYWARGLPVRLDLCPLADPSLRELLGDRGYRIADFLGVYVRALGRDEALPSPPPGVEIAVVGLGGADEWALTVERGFSGQDEVPESALDVSLATFHKPTATCFLARVEGRPVGGGALAVHEGLAMLMAASTRPAYRGRGVQTALLRARLVAAVAAGCDLATVRPSPGSASERNILRAGFRLAYTKAIMLREWA
jgi:GNAT superfamily N-acetyltransferase